MRSIPSTLKSPQGTPYHIPPVTSPQCRNAVHHTLKATVTKCQWTQTKVFDLSKVVRVAVIYSAADHGES